MKDTFAFDFKKNDFVLDTNDVKTVTGIDALKVWIEKALRTSKGYKIYTSYGSDIENLVIGKEIGFGFTESELKRTITETLLKNDDIYSINNIDILNNHGTLKTDIDITTSYGALQEVFNFDG